MIRRIIDKTVIDISADPRIPNVNLPLGKPFKKSAPGEINVTMEVGYLNVAVPGGKPIIKRGLISARGDNERIVWTHPSIGPFIEILPLIGRVRIMMPLEDWKRANDVLNQVLLPGLIVSLLEKRFHAMHASAVIYNDKGILFAGPTGSGKTTAALRMVDKGATLVSEDLLFLCSSGGDDKFMAWGLKHAPRADSKTWNRFPQWIPTEIAGSEKLTIDNDVLFWKRSTPVSKIFWLGEAKEGDAQCLLSLLSVTFHASDMELTTKFLSKFIKTVEYVTVSNPNEAFNLALQ